MTARLHHDHQALRAMADRLEAYLVGDAPPQDPEFSHLRWMMVREMTLHLATERAALARWQADSVELSRDFDFAFEEAFKQHVVKWSGASMISNWCRYCLETRALLRRMRKRMAFEERTLFPAIRRSRATDLA